jgi:hypothetical protein
MLLIEIVRGIKIIDAQGRVKGKGWKGRGGGGKGSMT